MNTTTTLPHQMPAIGGWYFDEKANKPRFLMPPYPGVDDAVETPAGLAYRRLAERDALADLDHGIATIARQNDANALALVEMQIDGLADRMCALLDKATDPGVDLDAIEAESEDILRKHRELSARRHELKGQR